ncbi:MAG: ABC-F family ATP-binding cassette domain-containing protein [Deltaproteobacteria bacterium]|nr:ABC-F family ATP-binding cassette domain-containing protein [Deltaproteobacteria bacterium]
MASIILSHVSFDYDSPYVKIFENVSLQIDTHWKTALIGRNGRGKTTLLNLVHKKIAPTRGEIEVPVETSYFPYAPKNDKQRTLDVIKDSIAPFRHWEEQMERLSGYSDEQHIRQYGEIAEHYERLGGYEIESAIQKEIHKIGLTAGVLFRDFSSLSGGEQTRALIIALFLRKEQFLLLDEPTNHLDLKGRISLADYLSGKEGFILASHDRFFLDACVDYVISIHRSGVRLNQGNYSEWKYQMKLEEGFEKRRDEKLEREIRQLKKAAQKRRTGAQKKEKEKIGADDKGFVGRKSAKQMKKALVIERRIKRNIEEKKALFKNYEKERALKFDVLDKSPQTLLNIQNLTVIIQGKTIIENFSLSVSQGERIAVLGDNGTGKTTLFNAICGDVKYKSGTIRIPGNVAFLRAFQKPLWGSGYLRRHLLENKLDETRFRQILGVLDVEGEIFERPLETFSQGQLKKVDLCRSFMSSANLFLWDEPVNYIDLMSREQIENAVLEFQPTLLFIEHDRYFIEKIATDAVMMDKA